MPAVPSATRTPQTHHDHDRPHTTCAICQTKPPTPTMAFRACPTCEECHGRPGTRRLSGYACAAARRVGDPSRRYLAAVLPEWPAGTVAILATAGDAPHAIPVSAAVRAGPRRILIALATARGSLARLLADPRVSLTIVCEDTA